mgnify:CR=1 FL=1
MQSHGGGNSRKQQFRERLGVLRETAVKRHLPEGRWTRRHWIHASLFTTIGVLMATIVPGFSAQLQPASQANATLPLQLPHLTMKSADRDAGAYWEVVQVESGQTLGQVFEDMGVPSATLHRILDTPANRAEQPDADFSRWVTPESMAGVILFLASDAARDINGAAVPVYGPG